MAGDRATGDADTAADLMSDGATLPASSDQPASGGSIPVPGDRIDRYEIVRFLGAGGMGVVLLARDGELEREVVIKLLRPDIAAGDEARDRLMREAQAMARISHPNVVPIYDVGTHRDQVFLAMEYVDGGDLERWLKGEPRSVDAIAAVFAGAARGLANAHDAGLVHRDFKPANVLVTRDGVAKVTDFGLARPSEDGGAVDLGADLASPSGRVLLTQTGAIMGTPAYMSPEQFRGAGVDARSDVFSFCVALHEAICGVRPFAGTNLAGLLEAIEAGERVAVTAARRPPPPIARLIDAGLSADPDRRPRSMREVVAALEPPRSRRGAAIAAIAAAVAVVALVAAGLTWRRAAASEPIDALGASCDAAARSIDATWGEPEARGAYRWFSDKARSPLEQAYVTRRAVRGFNRYRDRWREVYAESCRARSPLWPRQLDCLRDRREALAQKIAAVRSNPMPYIELPLSLRITPPADACSTEATMALLPPPLATEVSAESLALQREIVEAGTRGQTTANAEARAALEPLIARAVEIGARQVEALARKTRAELAKRAGDAAALDLYFEAIEVAKLARDRAMEIDLRVQVLELLANAQRFDEAERNLRYAEQALEGMYPDALTAARVADASASLSWTRGDRERAQKELLRSYKLKEDELGKADSMVVIARLELNAKLAASAQYEKAADFYARSFTLADEVFGGETTQTASYLFDYANVLNNLGRYDEALALAARGRAVFASLAGDTPIVTALDGVAATIHHRAGRKDQAYRLIDRAIEAATSVMGPRSELAITNRTLRALLLQRDDRHAEAAAALVEVLAAAEQNDLPFQAIGLRTSLARSELEIGELAAAEALLRANLARVENTLHPKSPERRDIEIALARLERLRGQGGRARERLEAFLAGIDAELEPDFHAIAAWELARVLPGAERARARQLATAARGFFGRPGGDPSTTAKIDAWLEAHRE